MSTKTMIMAKKKTKAAEKLAEKEAKRVKKLAENEARAAEKLAAKEAKKKAAEEAKVKKLAEEAAAKETLLKELTEDHSSKVDVVDEMVVEDIELDEEDYQVEEQMEGFTCDEFPGQQLKIDENGFIYDEAGDELLAVRDEDGNIDIQ